MKLSDMTISWEGLVVSLTCNSCATRCDGIGANETQSVVLAVLKFATFLASQASGCDSCRRSIASAVHSRYLSSFLREPKLFARAPAQNGCAVKIGYVEKHGPCQHCKRILGLVCRGICMTCWRTPGVKGMYEPRRRGLKPHWIKEGLADPRPLVAQCQEMSRRDRNSKRLARAVDREKKMPLVALLRREVEQVDDELVAIAMQVAMKTSPFRADEYLGPAWVAIREAYEAGERDQEKLFRAGRRGVKFNWDCESDDGVISLTVLKGTTGIEPVAPEEDLLSLE